MPSNVISIGSQVACRGHLLEVLKRFPKAKHRLSQRSLADKDKQNYSSINLLVKPCVEECLNELNTTMRTTGTVIYLRMMRDIRDSFRQVNFAVAANIFDVEIYLRFENLEVLAVVHESGRK